MKINFTKMHGCGNDFIVIDNRNHLLRNIDLHKLIKTICMRKCHIGANGVMLIENSNQATFFMRYFNSDGSEGEMCGNGARCIAMFAYENGIADREMTFETLDGIYEAKVLHNNKVQLFFPSIKLAEIKLHELLNVNGRVKHYHYATVGVPHTVVFKHDVEKKLANSFNEWARKIRYNSHFPNGTNVNIVEVVNEKHLSIRTYERGVEEETLACGSGATACAIITSLLGKTTSPVQVQTKGGVLEVSFQIDKKEVFQITLVGHAQSVFTGSFTNS